MEISTRIANNGKLQIILRDYYRNPAHIEAPYNAGMYGKIPAGPVQDCWSSMPHTCRDWMEWAYNNANQPTAEYDPKHAKRVAFLDASHANAVRNIGSLKSIWKDFEAETQLHSLPLTDIYINALEKRFWQYYINRYADKFERGVAVFEEYVRGRRCCMTPEERAFEKQNAPFFADDAVWIAGCHDFLRHLIYTTPRGYLMELILFAALRGLYGGTFTESDEAAEREGIDGYLERNGVKLPVSLKPNTYRTTCMSPLYTACWITYAPRKACFSHLIFEVQQGQELLENNGARSL